MTACWKPSFPSELKETRLETLCQLGLHWHLHCNSSLCDCWQSYDCVMLRGPEETFITVTERKWTFLRLAECPVQNGKQSGRGWGSHFKLFLNLTQSNHNSPQVLLIGEATSKCGPDSGGSKGGGMGEHMPGLPTPMSTKSLLIPTAAC